jgi:NAD-dependent dihydropyrimidine dehydrogenase PreA subunit
VDHHDCSGCGLCLLVCPVWQESRDIRLTPKGRARAIQHGADRAELAASIAGCTLCGACEPACPEELPLVDMVMQLRGDRNYAALGEDFSSFRKILVGGRSLPADGGLLAKILKGLPGFDLAADDGADIAAALESSGAIEQARLESFLVPLSRARRLVVADGLLLRAIRRWLPGIKSKGLGEALLPAVSAKLRAGDFYVIDSRSFNQDHSRLVGRYDALRAASGCQMNLDLQRIAMPVAGQARWILEGRKVERIVVEDLGERAAFAFAGKPVLHLAELA